jgi:CRISPR/Cas system-associated protein endoribonuclease Cas2
MASGLQYIQEYKPELEGRLTRGYYVDENTLKLSYETTAVKSEFGKSPKDVIEMSVYNLDQQLLGWRVVDELPTYEQVNIEFTNYEGDYVTGSSRLFSQNYTSLGNSVLVSPTHDLQKLELDRGTYYVRYCFLNNLCGSYENETKLVVKDISQTRTEIKIVPECLKTSVKPSAVSLSYEYINLINKKLPGAALYNFTDKLLKDSDVKSKEYQSELSLLVEDYEDVVEKTINILGGGTEKDVYINADTIKSDVYNLYKNILITKYNNTFTKSDYYIEYLNSVNYIISSHPRLGRDTTDSLVVDFFKTILISLFDVDYLESMYASRFDTYLTNYLNLGNGSKYPLLGIIPTNENLNDPDKHTPIVLKLYEPLPIDIEIGTKFYISSGIYSDDIMQKCNFFKSSKISSFKLRGPNLSATRSTTGTKQFKQEELETEEESRLDDTTKAISSYFNKNINNNDKDYTNFKNFVKYSSATRQLELFRQKLEKLSKWWSEIDRYEYLIKSLEEDIRNNIVSEADANSATSVLRNIDLADTKTKVFNELATLSEYERFLLYTESEDAWPRNSYVTIRSLTKKNTLANGRYDSIGVYNDKPMFKHRYGEWYIWWEDQDSAWILSDTKHFKLSNWIEVKNEKYYFVVPVISERNHAGFDPLDTITSAPGVIDVGLSGESQVVAPDPILSNANEWKLTHGYAWYTKKLKDAVYYDQTNDESLVMNIPEFLIRDESNDDFINFLNIIGLQFDEIHGYIENMGNSRGVRNDREKGIPDQLIYYFLNSLGMNFAGQDSSSDEIKKTGIVDKNSTEYRRNQIWRRILNNLPYLLKTKGTLASINALLRCYDIPEQLFSVREYGGVTEYSDDVSNKSAFVFDSYDYGLSISEENQYVELPWSYENAEARCIEFKVVLNEEARDIGTPIVILSGTSWEFGVKLDNTSRGEYGRFYFKSNDSESFCPVESTEPIYMWFEGGYEILLQKNQRFDALKRKTISILVKRKIDNRIVFSDTTDVIVNEEIYTLFSTDKSIYIGNQSDHKFRGLIDRIRIYTEPISESIFENHILFSQSYDIGSAENLSKQLLFKTNFDSPHDISEMSNYKTGYGIISNGAFGKSLETHAKCFNFIKTEFPYDFIGKFKREFAQLPSFGMHVFNNNKIRTEQQEIVGPLSPYNRATKKSLDRAGKDSNSIGLFFGPSVPLNEEIIKFFGDFKLGDYIGNPEDYDKSKYKDLNNFRKLFYREGFQRVDWSVYLNTLKGYIDPSLFENFEKLLPARTRVISGLVIEPTLLERTKFKGTAVSNEIQSNVSKLTVIEPTEKIKPLKNITLSGRNKNKDIVSFANEPVFEGKPNDNNVVCLTSKFNYKQVSGTSFKENLYNNFYENTLSPDAYGLTSSFGHYYIDGSLYRVEHSKESRYVSTKFNSGLVDYTITSKYFIDVSVDDKNKLSSAERNNLSSVDGRYVSSRNKNKRRVFENSAKTWFIYYEPYVESWVLINDNPFNYQNTETLLSNGTKIRFYAPVDEDGYFPATFSLNVQEEVRKLTGNYTTWSDFFVNERKTGPIGYYKFYSITSSVTIVDDKLMKLDGSVNGIVNCHINGSFTGEYAESLISENGTEVVERKKGHFRFSGSKHKLRLNGVLSATLDRGTVGNEETGSVLTLSDGFYNNTRFGGCSFSNKKMLGNINDIVENDPSYVKVKLDLYDSSIITKNEKEFDKIKLIPTPTKIKYKFENKIDANRRIELKRNSGNIVFYEDGVPKRNTFAKYDNLFYHKTKDIIQQPMLNNIRLTTNMKLETTELRKLDVIAYNQDLTSTDVNYKLEYRVHYKSVSVNEKQNEIDLSIKFKYSEIHQDYVCDITKYSPGKSLQKNIVYIGNNLNNTSKVETPLELDFTGVVVGDAIIDALYATENLILKKSKDDLLSELNQNNCCILAYDVSSDPDQEYWVYLLGNLDDTSTKIVDVHSYDFVQNAQEEFNYGGVNYLNSKVIELEDETSKTIRNDLIEVKHLYHKQTDPNLDIGDELSLEITANEKMKYYLPVNRELDVTQEDDAEALIYTKDTLNAVSTINIKDKFLTYKCTLDPIFNQGYFPQEKSLSKYFLVLGTSEYNGFLVDGFVGRWKSANGQYRTHNRKNKKLTYIHESSNWIVFYSLTKPNCNKIGIRGAWVLAKIKPNMFFEKEEAEIFSTDDALYMYAFNESDFNSTNEISYNDIELRAESFDTNYGTGPNETDIRYTGTISMYKKLCESQTFVEEQAKLRNEEVKDTSFTLIPVKQTFEVADRYGVNYIGARNNILAWSVHIDSVENKFPTRAVYEKIYPTKDFDVSVEVSYTNKSGITRPSVNLVGSDVRLSTFSKIEGEYYMISLIRNQLPVYRNANDYYIWKDTYSTKEGNIAVWVVSSDSQPLSTNPEDLIDSDRVVFVSSSGTCTTDDFNFRLGYDMTPNVYSTRHRNLTIATAFENASTSNSSRGGVVWGMIRNESACSTCDDMDYPTYDISITPTDASSLYIGSRKALDEIDATVVLDIECTRLDCDEELLDFYGTYSTSTEFESGEGVEYVNQIQDNVVVNKETTGWEISYLRILNERSTNKLISSKSTKVTERNPSCEYPKYGEYISDAGSISYLYLEKDEYDDILLHIMSDNDQVHNRTFIKTTLIKNNKSVWHSNYEWFIFSNIDEFTEIQSWCISDILSDKKIQYKERVRDDGTGNDMDEIYGIYYIERQGELDFDETKAIVANRKINFTISENDTLEINKYDPSTFTYKVRSEYGYQDDTDAFDVRKVLSTTSNRISTNIPVDFNYKPDFFGLDIPKSAKIRISNDGKLNNVSNPVVDFSIDFLENKIQEDIQIRIKDQYKRTTNEVSETFNYEFLSQDNPEQITNTLTTKRFRLNKQISNSVPEIRKISLTTKVDVFTSKDQTYIIENEKLINEAKDIVESFEDGSDEMSRELIVPFTNRCLYFNEIDYRLCDVNKIKIDGDLVSRGKQKQHLSKRRNLFRKRTANSVNTTVNRAGEIDRTPPIVRKRVPLDRVGGTTHDSFWFTDDTPVVTQTTPVPPRTYKGFSDLSNETRSKLEAYYSFNTAYEISWPNTPTPSPTNTATPTETNTPTLTPSPLPSPTPIPSPTGTPTQSPTLTSTPSPTNTHTPTITPTSTASATPSPTASFTPSLTSTPYVPTFLARDEETPTSFKLSGAKAKASDTNIILDGVYYLVSRYNNRPVYTNMWDLNKDKVEVEIWYETSGLSSYWYISSKVKDEDGVWSPTKTKHYYASSSAIHPGLVTEWKWYGNVDDPNEMQENPTLTEDLSGMFDIETYSVHGTSSENNFNNSTNNFQLKATPLKGSTNNTNTITKQDIFYIEGMEFNYTGCDSNAYQYNLSEGWYKPNQQEQITQTSEGGSNVWSVKISRTSLVEIPASACFGEYIEGTGNISVLKNIKGGPDLTKEFK